MTREVGMRFFVILHLNYFEVGLAHKHFGNAVNVVYVRVSHIFYKLAHS